MINEDIKDLQKMDIQWDLKVKIKLWAWNLSKRVREQMLTPNYSRTLYGLLWTTRIAWPYSLTTLVYTTNKESSVGFKLELTFFFSLLLSSLTFSHLIVRVGPLVTETGLWQNLYTLTSPADFLFFYFFVEIWQFFQ